jgi:hypothetical protein
MKVRRTLRSLGARPATIPDKSKGEKENETDFDRAKFAPGHRVFLARSGANHAKESLDLARPKHKRRRYENYCA